MTCPRCSGNNFDIDVKENVKRREIEQGVICILIATILPVPIILILLIFFLLSRSGAEWVCQNCGHRLRAKKYTFSVQVTRVLCGFISYFLSEVFFCFSAVGFFSALIGIESYDFGLLNLLLFVCMYLGEMITVFSTFMWHTASYATAVAISLYLLGAFGGLASHWRDFEGDLMRIFVFLVGAVICFVFAAILTATMVVKDSNMEQN